MSTIFVVIVILGIAGTLFFALGFAKGLKDAIADIRDPKPEPEDVDERGFAPLTVAAVALSAVIIGLLGVSPYVFYVGPLLAIVTTFGVALAFFKDGRDV